MKCIDIIERDEFFNQFYHSEDYDKKPPLLKLMKHYDDKLKECFKELETLNKKEKEIEATYKQMKE